MLGRRTATGSVLLIGVRLIARVIDLITMLVLSRLLLPKDFGLVAIAAGVVAILEAALELPVNQALVRLPHITVPQLDTAFTLSLMRGAVLASILLLGAVPIARAYHDPRLTELICFLSVAPVMRSLISPRLAEYQKNMVFWRDVAIELGGKFVGFAFATGLAIATGSYWSIAAGTVAFTTAMTIASYFLAPYRPRLSLSELPIFSGFIGWLSAGQVVNALNWQFERLLLGKLRSATQLGLFATASDITMIPFLALFGPIGRPLLAAFAHLGEDQGRLARSYQNASRAVVAAGLPLVVGQSLVAQPAVRLILGERWAGAAPLLHWLSLSLIPALFTVPAYPLIMAFGKTKLFLQRNALEFCVKLPIAVVGVWKFGFAGLIVARLVSEVAVDIFSMFAVRRLIGLSIATQLGAPWRSVASALVMVPPVLLCMGQFSATGGVAETALRLFCSAAIGAATYGAASWALWRITGQPSGPEAMVLDAVRGLRREGKVGGAALGAAPEPP